MGLVARSKMPFSILQGFCVISKTVRSDHDVCSRVNPEFFSQAEPVQILAEESRAQGTIGVGLYVKYLRAGASILTLLAIILVNFLAQVRKKTERK